MVTLTLFSDSETERIADLLQVYFIEQNAYVRKTLPNSIRNDDALKNVG